MKLKISHISAVILSLTYFLLFTSNSLASHSYGGESNADVGVTSITDRGNDIVDVRNYDGSVSTVNMSTGSTFTYDSPDNDNGSCSNCGNGFSVGTWADLYMSDLRFVRVDQSTASFLAEGETLETGVEYIPFVLVKNQGPQSTWYGGAVRETPQGATAGEFPMVARIDEQGKEDLYSDEDAPNTFPKENFFYFDVKNDVGPLATEYIGANSDDGTPSTYLDDVGTRSFISPTVFWSNWSAGDTVDPVYQGQGYETGKSLAQRHLSSFLGGSQVLPPQVITVYQFRQTVYDILNGATTGGAWWGEAIGAAGATAAQQDEATLKRFVAANTEIVRFAPVTFTNPGNFFLDVAIDPGRKRDQGYWYQINDVGCQGSQVGCIYEAQADYGTDQRNGTDSNTKVTYRIANFTVTGDPVPVIPVAATPVLIPDILPQTVVVGEELPVIPFTVENIGHTNFPTGFTYDIDFQNTADPDVVGAESAALADDSGQQAYNAVSTWTAPVTPGQLNYAICIEAPEINRTCDSARITVVDAPIRLNLPPLEVYVGQEVTGADYFVTNNSGINVPNYTYSLNFQNTRTLELSNVVENNAIPADGVTYGYNAGPFNWTAPLTPGTLNYEICINTPVSNTVCDRALVTVLQGEFVPTINDMTVDVGEVVTQMPYSVINQTTNDINQYTYDLNFQNTATIDASGTENNPVTANGGTHNGSLATNNWTAPLAAGRLRVELCVNSASTQPACNRAFITVESQCTNNTDDDSDGFEDFDGNGGTRDPGCSGPNDNTESPNPQCSDGVDNADTEDSLVDYDGGGVGLPDPGCSGPYDNDETDTIPTPTIEVDISAPSLVRKSEDFEVSWTLNGATNCSFTGPTAFTAAPAPNPTTDGTKTVSLSNTTTFTLDCDEDSDSVTVRVLPTLYET